MNDLHAYARSALDQVHTVVRVGPKSWNRRLVAHIGSMALAIGLVVAPSPAAAIDQEGMLAASLMPSVSQVAAEALNWNTPTKASQIAPFVELGALDSHPGEQKEAYMLRVARVLDAFTSRTRHEACSAIMVNEAGDAWRVRLITNRSQMACMRIIFDEPGFFATSETIHSHPKPRRFEGTIKIRVNAVDSRLRSRPCGAYMSVEDNRFSDGDLKNGSGYLVARGQLLYNDGASNHPRLVGSVDSSTPMDKLSLGGAVGLSTTESGVHAATAVWTPVDSNELPSTSCKRPGS